MVMVTSFDKYHHLKNFSILVTILFFMIEIQAYWIQRYFNLTNKILFKKDIVQD